MKMMKLMDYKDSLTQSFSHYLDNHITLLQIISQLVDVKLKTSIRRGKEPQGKQIVDNQFYRDLQVGISRAEYYQKKIKDVDVIELDMVKEAEAEMDPLFEIVKERMQTLE